MEEDKKIHLPTQEPTPSQQTTKWSELRTNFKVSRRSYCTTCIYDNKMYCYGGVDIGEGPIGTFYSLSIQDILPTWKQHTLTGPCPITICRHASSLIENLWYISGGESNNDSSNKILCINLDKFTISYIPLKGDDLPKIDSHTMSTIQIENNPGLIIIGGFQNTEKSNEVFGLMKNDDKGLKCIHYKCTGGYPMPRSNHSAITIKDAIYIFGGVTEEGQHLNDLWKLEKMNWELIKTENAPIPRCGHSAIEFNGCIVIFGGQEAIGKERNDICKYNIASSKWEVVFTNSEPPQVELRLSSPIKKVELSKAQISPTNMSKTIKPLNHNIFDMLQEQTLINISPKHTLLNKQGSMNKEFAPNKTMYNNGDVQRASSIRNSGIDYYNVRKENIQDPSQSFRLTSFKSTDAGIRYKEEPTSGFTQGKYPCYRDGHSACIYQNKMIIFGGDRNRLSFNDVFTFNLID